MTGAGTVVDAAGMATPVVGAKEDAGATAGTVDADDGTAAVAGGTVAANGGGETVVAGGGASFCAIAAPTEAKMATRIAAPVLIEVCIDFGAPRCDGRERVAIAAPANDSAS